MRLIKRGVSKGELSAEPSRGNGAVTIRGVVVTALDPYRLRTCMETDRGPTGSCLLTLEMSRVRGPGSVIMKPSVSLIIVQREETVCRVSAELRPGKKMPWLTLPPGSTTPLCEVLGL